MQEDLDPSSLDSAVRSSHCRPMHRGRGKWKQLGGIESPAWAPSFQRVPGHVRSMQAPDSRDCSRIPLVEKRGNGRRLERPRIGGGEELQMVLCQTHVASRPLSATVESGRRHPSRVSHHMLGALSAPAPGSLYLSPFEHRPKSTRGGRPQAILVRSRLRQPASALVSPCRPSRRHVVPSRQRRQGLSRAAVP